MCRQFYQLLIFRPSWLLRSESNKTNRLLTRGGEAWTKAGEGAKECTAIPAASYFRLLTALRPIGPSQARSSPSRQVLLQFWFT